LIWARCSAHRVYVYARHPPSHPSGDEDGTKMKLKTIGMCGLAATVFVSTALASLGPTNDAVVTFDSGAEGWSLLGWDTTTATGGNPGARLHWDDFVDNFTMAARTSTHPAFIGDYTQKGVVTLGIDFQVNYVMFFGTPVPRDLVVILYDDDMFLGAAPAAVWTTLGTLVTGLGWTGFETIVPDVHSSSLPSGWNGAGDEDPMTFEPILPAGRTWTNVLQGIDRVEFTTGVPGFFYGFTNFNLSIDNVRIQPLSGSSFCDDADGSLASCPCANAGAPDTGCDIQQGTGGVKLDFVAQQTAPLNRVTWSGTGFPATSSPTSIVIRAAGLDPASPVVFGDGLRCIGVPLVRLAATFAGGGTVSHTHGHNALVGSGSFYYQLWFRNTPVMFCDPAAAFNLSNGRILAW